MAEPVEELSEWYEFEFEDPETDEDDEEAEKSEDEEVESSEDEDDEAEREAEDLALEDIVALIKEAAAEEVVDQAAVLALWEAAVAKLDISCTAETNTAKNLHLDEPVDLWSLREGQQHVGTRRGGSLVRIRAVEVGHASALEAMLRRQIADLSLITGLERLPCLAKVDLLLTLGAEAHVPIISEHIPIVGSIPIINNRHSVYGDDNAIVCEHLRAFRQWTWDVHTAAAAVGPASIFGESFLKTIKTTVCKASRKIVEGALRGRSEDWLRPKVVDVQLVILTIKEGSVLFHEVA